LPISSTRFNGRDRFGPNMTTLTFSISRALGRWLGEGDEIIVTRLDHDANIAPWRARRAAQLLNG
jgi:selenocysteine lyase/cysteine desulfurase